jgi:FSR family fosmidomycin resistance protein-like MFS transporter
MVPFPEEGGLFGIAALRRMAGLTALLIGVDFLDELSSGIPFVASPEIKSEFGVSYGQAAGWLLTAVGVLGVIFEPPLFVLADRHPRRWFVCGGLAVLGATCLLAAAAPSYGVLVVALLLFGPASGCGVTLSQATLMDANPRDRDRMMVRWTLAGELGDLVVPAFLTLMVWLGGGWRWAFAAVGGILFAYAALLWRQPFPDSAGAAGRSDEPRRGLLAPLRLGLGRSRLLLWGGATILCSLLDEILVAFGSLFLRDEVGLGLEARASVLTVLMLGGALGLLGLDRLLRRFDPLPILAFAGAGSALAFCAWLTVRDPWASGLFFFLTGVFSAAHYPLAQSQAYRALPEGSGTVNALLTAGGVVLLPIPVLLGVVADSVGLVWALAVLTLQPVGVLVAALLAMRRGG